LGGGRGGVEDSGVGGGRSHGNYNPSSDRGIRGFRPTVSIAIKYYIINNGTDTKLVEKVFAKILVLYNLVSILLLGL
jgi:hypothetical protein